jgi:hypothetical protein
MSSRSSPASLANCSCAASSSTTASTGSATGMSFVTETGRWRGARAREKVCGR